ncbi:hypothetical protein B0H17DRAFT_1125109 [Mycena rosella]|uniref:Uncharacterized protein n=1 Tax=Mycena rosella TaxID=1033263 RepID=A0AAD7GZE9_MYCRO|nr:hypothetical protein B0H17DRAFT_1125109 [Mycena rosella]
MDVVKNSEMSRQSDHFGRPPPSSIVGSFSVWPVCGNETEQASARGGGGDQPNFPRYSRPAAKPQALLKYSRTFTFQAGNGSNNIIQHQRAESVKFSYSLKNVTRGEDFLIDTRTADSGGPVLSSCEAAPDRVDNEPVGYSQTASENSIGQERSPRLNIYLPTSSKKEFGPIAGRKDPALSGIGSSIYDGRSSGAAKPQLKENDKPGCGIAAR